jgi:hypothetical protein
MINQQINLYLPEFKAKKAALKARVMGQILGGTLVVMLIITAYDYVSSWRLSTELVRLQETLVEETRKTGELETVLARRSQNIELGNRLQLAESRLESNRQIRDFLSDTTLGNVVGFSEYFKDLSRAAFDGLSLTEFSFANGGDAVTLSGQVRDSSMVPRYVNNIASGRSNLRTKHFSPLISRSEIEDQFFSFVLSSTGE